MPQSSETPLLTVTGHTLVLAPRRSPLPDIPGARDISGARASTAGNLLARLPARRFGPSTVIMIVGAARRLGRRAVRGARRAGHD
ncbi:hypothetical protein [Streptomyces sp. AK02-01A]|uniref:hypothetical protein n=1 Tax=Streptomyces sp. AK02-01A TaxID=3028648 RepID=UPI0029A9B2D8|nr:hypothetical protein [Streptomyces sp. AK02-01A]MDX3849064.1 hypothetical protein [Streptomyces sp. AK02-01A]